MGHGLDEKGLRRRAIAGVCAEVDLGFVEMWELRR
jgi:hypothetical protein